MAWILFLHLLSTQSFAVDLKEGAGKEKVLTHCQTCHSLDYIPMNSFLGEEGWKNVVEKMRLAYGAPIPEEDVQVIVRYLGAR